MVKNERDALEADSKNKMVLLMQKLKELQVQNKTAMEQLHAQSKQCDHLNGENKQLLEYVVRSRLPLRQSKINIDVQENDRFLFVFLLVGCRTAIARKTIFSPSNSFL